jgi:hypothetical protein
MLNIKFGDRYNRLTIIEETKKHILPNGKKRRQFICKCDCGTIKTFVLNDLTNNKTKSCGCLNNRLKNGSTINGKRTNEYNIWNSMKQRCNNPNMSNYKYYGGRGIKVCDRWINSYNNFLEDMGMKPGPEYSIDRINNDGDYEPSNCKWSTASEQIKNRRKKIL